MADLNGLTFDSIGSMNVHYSFLVSATRTSNSAVTYNVTCKCWLNSSSSFLGNGGTLTFQCSIGGVTGSAVLKESSEIWKGTSPRSVTAVLTGVPSSSAGAQTAEISVINTGYQYGNAAFGARSYTVYAPALLGDAGVITNDISCQTEDTIPLTITHSIPNNGYSYQFTLYVDNIQYVWPADLPGDHVVGLSTAMWNEIYEQMANQQTAKLTIGLLTYLDGNLLGTTSKDGVLSIPASLAPIFPGFSYQDTNELTIALTENSQYLIQGKSNLQVICQAATAQKSSSISKYAVTASGNSASGTGLTYELGTLFSQGNITATVYDSRGLFSSLAKSPVWIPFEDCKITSASMSRTSDLSTSASVSIEGNYSLLTVDGSPKNIPSCQYRYKRSSLSSWSDWYSAEISYSEGRLTGSWTFDGLDVNYSYNIEIRLSDKLSAYTYTGFIGSGTPLLSYRKGKIGINKIPENGALDINGDLYVNGKTVHTMEGVTWTPRVEMQGSTQPIRNSSGTAYKVGNIAVITYTITFSQPLSADEALWITDLPYNIPFGHYPLGDYFYELATKRINGYMSSDGEGNILVRRMDEPWTYSVMNTTGAHVKDGTIFSGTFVCTVI